ncbi:hypothetical protein BDC45DRAFT_570212 [Circinella umbellata]|nr:hypothetical protein BDC45DRAFT_570212 [Circinella umbellata]
MLWVSTIDLERNIIFMTGIRRDKLSEKNQLTPRTIKAVKHVTKDVYQYSESRPTYSKIFLKTIHKPVESQKDIYTFYAGYMLWLVFPSVATISELIASVLHRLLEQPKLINELINDQNEAFGDLASVDDIKNYLTSAESIRKLVKLDSVCRESFRISNDITASDRTNSDSNNVILSNGIIIPPSYHDSKVQKDTLENYDKFEPFRHLETQLTTTKTGEDSMLFGIGKHVCP